MQQLLRTRSKIDFISGKVKEGVRSEKVKVICDQIGARAKAIEIKTAMKAKAKADSFYNYIEESRSQMAVSRAIRKAEKTEQQLISKEKYNQDVHVEYMDLEEFVALKEETEAIHERHEQAQIDRLDTLRTQEAESQQQALSEIQQQKASLATQLADELQLFQKSRVSNVSTEKDLAEALATATMRKSRTKTMQR